MNNIKYLRYFEATARLGSIAAAAQEIGVTAAAVSQKIRSFEQDYNINLFNRFPNSLVLTDEARSLLPDITRALNTIDKVTGNIKKDELAGELIINSAPSLGLQWLMPKIKNFICRYPQVSLTIFSDEFPSFKDLEKFDIRIIHGTGGYEPLNSQLLMTDKVFPVLSPALQAVKPIRNFEDLANHTLLHDIRIEPSETSLKWQRWFECEVGKSTLPKHNIYFGNANLMLDAARNGLGVALGRSALVKSYLVSGELIAPLNIQKLTEHAYYTVTSNLMAQSMRVITFRAWLKEQVDQG